MCVCVSRSCFSQLRELCSISLLSSLAFFSSIWIPSETLFRVVCSPRAQYEYVYVMDNDQSRLGPSRIRYCVTIIARSFDQPIKLFITAVTAEIDPMSSQNRNMMTTRHINMYAFFWEGGRGEEEREYIKSWYFFVPDIHTLGYEPPS